MTTLKASDARIPTREFNRVAYQGERVCIERRDGDHVYLISEEDLRLLEELEDRYWAEEGIRALKRHEQSGSKTVPLARVKSDMGL